MCEGCPMEDEPGCVHGCPDGCFEPDDARFPVCPLDETRRHRMIRLEKMAESDRRMIR